MVPGDRPERGRLRALVRRFRRSELGGLAGDTGYVTITQASELCADLVQIALITHALGLAEYGRFALVVAFATIVSAFFNLRVAIAATTHGARYITTEPRVATGVFQLTCLLDLSSGAVFGLAMVALTLLLGTGIVGGVSGDVVLVFTLVLLARNVENTPIAVLRLLDRMRLIAGITFVTEMTRVALVAAALQIHGTLLAVAAAMAIAKLAGAAVKGGLAVRAFAVRHPGERLTRPALRRVDNGERRAIRRTVFHSSLLSYEGISQVHVPTLVLGWLAGAVETGLYKVGMVVASVIGNAAAPASAALLPRLSRLWSAGRLRELRRLLRHATLFSLPAIVALYAGLVIFRDPVLELLGGGAEARAAGTVLLLGAAGQAVYAAVFWRSSLLLAAFRTGTVAKVSVAGAAFQTAAVFALVPSLGAEGAALAYLMSRTAINGTLAYVAVRTINNALSLGQAPVPR